MIVPPIRCVLDASVGIKRVLNEPDTPLALSLLSHASADPSARFFVPDFFFLECGSILRKQVQRSLMQSADAIRKLGQLEALPLNPIATGDLAAAALQISLSHAVSAYDACYVAASDLLNVPLSTADNRLVRKLAGSPFPVLLLGSLTIPP